MIRERERQVMNGAVMLVASLVGLVLSVALFIYGLSSHQGAYAVGAVLLFLTALIVAAGLFTVSPNEARVLQLFGAYVGTVRLPGLRWANPLYTKHKVSTRVRNFESAKLKVNDLDGNPIEIAAVAVWRVVDTAEAVFEVDDFNNYVHVQSESALRNLATSYAYDSHDDQESLRGSTGRIAEHLKQEVQDRLAKAGVEVLEARISHLAYAPEIAAAMLQRQQAGAIIAARQKIVEGAVGMVEMALEMLAAKHVVELDNERRAQMVSNLLVVLCGERGTQPVVNTGTIYQ
jgi:regulator of protease activity HflC (stomatin/prohibitin superfamily)